MTQPTIAPRRTGPAMAVLAALALAAPLGSALAQPAPPPPEMAGRPPMPGPMHGMEGMRPGMPPPWMMLRRRGPFAGLVFPREDRQLTAAEVGRIAEAFLLFQGERSWKIVEVAEAEGNTVRFALATAEGSVIARFSMDRATGRLRRIG